MNNIGRYKFSSCEGAVFYHPPGGGPRIRLFDVPVEALQRAGFQFRRTEAVLVDSETVSDVFVIERVALRP